MKSLDGGSGESRISPDSSEPSGLASGERIDNFRKAKILKFFPHLGYGFVRDRNGKDIYFHLDEVRFVGEKKDRSDLVEGREVGIDVGITSRGIRVTRLKIY